VQLFAGSDQSARANDFGSCRKSADNTRAAEFCASAARVSALALVTVRAPQLLPGLLGLLLEEKLAPSVHEGQTVRHQVGENVGVNITMTPNGAERDWNARTRNRKSHAFDLRV